MTLKLILQSLVLLPVVACVQQPNTTKSNNPSVAPVILRQSWEKYVDRFIQEDGRVIDHKGGGISTSEGQAYAMLRAVWMDDRQTFDKAYRWGKDNLNSKVRSDRLWAWKWGNDADGTWHVLDRAFASDADQDVALALILAWKTWNDVDYWTAAQQVLEDLWKSGTVQAGGRRFMIAGDTLCQNGSCRLNPSYAAPYAYRIFAQYDTARNWSELVDTSYFLLETTSKLTQTRLPPDWLLMDLKSGQLALGNEKDSSFSYDAFRVFWRIALDRDLFNDPRSSRYLQDSLSWIRKEWQSKRALPAVISATGQAKADYESIEMLSGLLPALKNMTPDVANDIDIRIASQYQAGVWAEPDSYYIQNWAWFGSALYNGYIAPFERLRY